MHKRPPHKGMSTCAHSLNVCDKPVGCMHRAGPRHAPCIAADALNAQKWSSVCCCSAKSPGAWPRQEPRMHGPWCSLHAPCVPCHCPWHAALLCCLLTILATLKIQRGSYATPASLILLFQHWESGLERFLLVSAPSELQAAQK